VALGRVTDLGEEFAVFQASILVRDGLIAEYLVARSSALALR
jgi:hypothetical protein